MVNGEKLSSLPPSVLAVMEADRNGGNFSPLRNATIGEWEVTTDNAVSGSRILTITVESAQLTFSDAHACSTDTLDSSWRRPSRPPSSPWVPPRRRSSGRCRRARTS